jgi:hypothetical protein
MEFLSRFGNLGYVRMTQIDQIIQKSFCTSVEDTREEGFTDWEVYSCKCRFVFLPDKQSRLKLDLITYFNVNNFILISLVVV